MHLFRGEDAPDDAGTTIFDGGNDARRDRSPFDIGILDRRNDRTSGITIARDVGSTLLHLALDLVKDAGIVREGSPQGRLRGANGVGQVLDVQRHGILLVWIAYASCVLP